MSGRRREALLTAAVGFAAVVIQLPIFDRWLALLDEGYLLELADEVNRGKLLYRDVYVDAPLPGAFYALAAWFRVAGTSIWSARLLAVALFAVLAMLLFRVGRAVLPRGWALGLAALVLCYRIWAFPDWHFVSYSTLAATLLAAALVLALHHLATGSRVAVLASGTLAGLGILCKQDYGACVGGALGVFLAARPLVGSGRFGPAALYAAGGALVVLPAFAAALAAGLLGPLVEQAVVRPFALVSGFAYPHLPPLGPLLHQDAALRADIWNYFPAILLTLRWDEIAAGWVYRRTPLWDVALKLAFYGPFIVWGAAALLWARGERRLLVLAYAGGFLLTFNPPRDWVHLMMIFPPTLVLGTALAAQAATRAPRVAAGLAAVGLAVAAAVSAGLAVDLRHEFAWPLRAPRAGIRVDARHGPIIEDILAYIDAHAPPGTP
ncbi:MAG TPA: glycosyltransferase family 39 protein, partial [Verrucomicrobiae bacterium]|nr:glycosyltransferase family 39 protein [Verrucomicrobiae bacterium]